MGFFIESDITRKHILLEKIFKEGSKEKLASSKLFPPILNSYIKAFVNTSTLRIPFKLSQFNTKSEFNSVHLSIVKLDTNLSVLNKTVYPNGIKIYNNSSIIQEETGDGFFLNLSSNDLQWGWEKGLYKIQLRLSEKEYNGVIGEAEWLTSNASYFSEWSTIALTKAIGNVYISEPNFFPNGEKNNDAQEDILYLNSLEFNGVYNNTNDLSETLKTFQLQLFDSEDVLLEDSKQLDATIDNKLQYSFKTECSAGDKYTIKCIGITKNYYEIINTKTFTLEQVYTTPLKVTLYSDDEDIELDEEEGKITVHVSSNDDTIFSGNINMRRTSSKTNFLEWEDVYNVTINGEVIDFTFEDYTAESGVYYLYSVRKVDVSIIGGNLIKDYGSMTYISSPIMREFNHSYLLGQQNQQLKLSFNYQISNYQKKVKDVVTETIGGKYPFITRNGNMNYRTFPISGTISFLGDENNYFIEEEELFGGKENLDLYESRSLLSGNITFEYDYIKERFFREKVIEFLQDNKPKLYKSNTEGNMIVRITDVSLTPNTTLGRLIFDFSANVYEIDEITQENLLKYQFYSLSDLCSEFITKRIKVGQYINSKTPVSKDITVDILNFVDYSNKNILGYRYTTDKIYKVRIEFNSKPMLILDQNNREMIGYKMSLNGKIVTVGKFGYYVLDSLVDLQSLIFYGDKDGKIKSLDVTIDFIYEQKQELVKGKTIKSRTTKKNIGQYFGSVACGSYIYSILYYKYYFEWAKEYQRLVQINGLTIEANPNVTLLIKDYHDKIVDKQTIGSAGILNFSNYDNNIALITNIGVYGTYYGELFEYREEPLVDFSIKGEKKVLYTKDDKKYVFDRNTYLEVEIDEDQKIYDKKSNVDLLIDYKYFIERGTYYEDSI